MVVSLYQYYVGRRDFFDITDISTINSAVIDLSGDWTSDSYFLRLMARFRMESRTFVTLIKHFSVK
jgi:hypothetical protein